MQSLILMLLYFTLPNNSPKDYFTLSDDVFFSLLVTLDTIPLSHPDTLLLDAAIFQATNQARREHGLSPFNYDACLYKASSQHATYMVERNFYGHNNPFSPFEKTVDKRVDLCNKRFMRIGENIGRYQIIMSKDWLAVRWNKNTDQYDFIDPQDNRSARPYTYSTYAHHVVSQWMASPTHRSNILSTTYTYIGCAARLCMNPYKQRRPPFASTVQNFGSEN